MKIRCPNRSCDALIRVVDGAKVAVCPRCGGRWPVKALAQNQPRRSEA